MSASWIRFSDLAGVGPDGEAGTSWAWRVSDAPRARGRAALQIDRWELEGRAVEAEHEGRPLARRRTPPEAEAWLLARLRDHRVRLDALDRLAAWAGAPSSSSVREVARAVVLR